MQVDRKQALEQARERMKDPENQKRVDAARQFEGVLVRQLMSVMRNSAKSGGMGASDGASGQYTQMFDDAMADSMTAGGGIGLARSFLEAMGGNADDLQVMAPSKGAGGAPSSGGGIADPSAARPAVTPPLPSVSGATARLASAAYGISAPEGGKQWSREGTLTERDLASTIETSTPGGVARFNVREAQGYRDAYKCNLFAFEAARRAGFEVPVVARPQGYGYPTTNTVTEDARDGAVRGGWAEVVPKERIGELKDKVARGEVALMLTGAGQDGKHGHMAVVERIHSIELDDQGEVKHIEFDGYEARANGAEHLTRRSWNLRGNGEDSRLARNGFGAIEILALKPAKDAQAPEIRLSEAVRPSREADR